MGYVDENLLQGEEVVHRGAIHWAVFIPHVVIMLGGIAFTIVSLSLFPFALMVCAAMAIDAAVRKTNTEMVVTTKRVIMKTGFLSRRAVELNLAKVETLAVDQDMVAQILGYGTVTVVGSGGTREAFQYVDKPLEFRRAIQRVTVPV